MNLCDLALANIVSCFESQTLQSFGFSHKVFCKVSCWTVYIDMYTTLNARCIMQTSNDQLQFLPVSKGDSLKLMPRLTMVSLAFFNLYQRNIHYVVKERKDVCSLTELLVR